MRSSVKIVRLRSAILTEKTRAADVLVFQLVIHIHMTAKKERKNRRFAYWSWGYHLLLPFLSALLGAGWAFLAFIPSSLRAWFFHGRDWPVKTIGILEIVNAGFFFAVMCICITS